MLTWLLLGPIHQTLDTRDVIFHIATVTLINNIAHYKGMHLTTAILTVLL